MRKYNKKRASFSKFKKRHPLDSYYDDAREMLREEMFSTHNKFLEKVAYKYHGEIVNTYSNKNHSGYFSIGMSIESFDKKNKGNTFGDTIDKLEFILIHFSNKNKETISNCKKLLKLYKKYKWPLEKREMECRDSENSNLIYMPIMPVTWPDGVDENYEYMEELCILVANCVDETSTID